MMMTAKASWFSRALEGVSSGGDGHEVLVQSLQHGGHGEQVVGLVVHDEHLGHPPRRRCRQSSRVLDGGELPLQQVAARLGGIPLLMGRGSSARPTGRECRC